jgi:hypothetical protein
MILPKSPLVRERKNWGRARASEILTGDILSDIKAQGNEKSLSDRRIIPDEKGG